MSRPSTRREVLVLIPARGGSKGIPGKNLKVVGGRSLLAWVAGAAKKSGLVTRIVLSSDDGKIINAGRKLGLEVPFVRPKRLAGDSSPTMPVIAHALDFLKSSERYIPDAVLLLQPSSPMVRSTHIDGALKLFFSKRAPTSVVSVFEVPEHLHPYWCQEMSGGGLRNVRREGARITRRQDLPKAYCRNGAIYVLHPSSLKKADPYGRRSLPYLMSHEDSLDIDTPDDLKAAARLLRRRRR